MATIGNDGTIGYKKSILQSISWVWILRKHFIKNRHDSVIEISAWSQDPDIFLS